MTGLLTSEHGLWANGGTLSEYHPTIASTMTGHGWQTAHFGKMHLVPILNRVERHPAYGFQTWEVAEGDQQLTHDDYFLWLRRRNPDAFCAYLDEAYAKGHSRGYASKLPEELHLSTWVTHRSIDWLEHRRKGDSPFFLSVGYFDPHHAFNPCQPYADAFTSAEMTPPVFREGSIDSRPAHYRQLFKGCRETTRDSQSMTGILRAYHAMVSHVDKCVGDLLATLTRLGLEKDTAVIFSSDHGELLGNHGLLWKGPYLLDDLLRVPAIVSVPGGEGEGRRCDQITSGLDWMATVQTLAGASEPYAASGRTMLGNDLELLPTGAHPFTLTEWGAPNNGPTRSLRCIRTPEAKLVSYADPAEGELYDLANDPHEFSNLYHDPRHAPMRQSLEAMLCQAYVHRRPHAPVAGGW